ncbi:uncharacterized protein LOC132901931 [Amyelois transitella]|uniref:uncharacterized protein LOC132901931 n=1 Tax=Amyelois transitella TaxID=680683 RepID=UPI00298FAC86|nr:uncharacterized protein LOC132901931 [Amyelois transitella]
MVYNYKRKTERAFNSTFKTFFEIEINKFQKQYPGRVMDQYDVAKLVSQAYLRSATPQNALSGFRASGIQPFDRYAIGEEYFAPSAVYNREVQPQEPHRNDHHLNLLQVTENLPAQIFDEEHEPPAPPCSENLNQLMENIQPKNAEVIEQVEVETFPSALSQVDRGTARYTAANHRIPEHKKYSSRNSSISTKYSKNNKET